MRTLHYALNICMRHSESSETRDLEGPKLYGLALLSMYIIGTEQTRP